MITLHNGTNDGAVIKGDFKNDYIDRIATDQPVSIGSRHEPIKEIPFVLERYKRDVSNSSVFYLYRTIKMYDDYNEIFDAAGNRVDAKVPE